MENIECPKCGKRTTIDFFGQLGVHTVPRYKPLFLIGGYRDGGKSVPMICLESGQSFSHATKTGKV